VKQKTTIAKNFNDIILTEVVLYNPEPSENHVLIRNSINTEELANPINPIKLNKNKEWTVFKPLSKEEKELANKKITKQEKERIRRKNILKRRKMM